jgi:glycerophosphoryl diester phosphodiesterase
MPAHATPPLIAHRLGAAYGPDSSAAALAGALSAGVQGLETDVCLTGDGDLVCLHDPLLRLGTDLHGWAHERTAAEIRAGYLIGDDGEPSDEHPLSVDELLYVAPADVVVQLEVKSHADRQLAERTALAICERYRLGPQRTRIEVISFHSRACAVAAAHGFRSRLVIWADYAPEALAVWAVRNRVAGVSVEHFLLSERFARVLRLAGLSVNTGTINDAELLARVVERAAPDAVCTDRPAELRAEAAEALARSASAAPVGVTSGAAC